MYLDGKDVTLFIDFIFKNNLTENIMLKVPRNYDLKNLNLLGYPYETFQLKKGGNKISYILFHIKQKKILTISKLFLPT